MIRLLGRALFILGAVAIVSFVNLAAPVHAQQDAIVSPGWKRAERTNAAERQFRQIQGDIDQPIERARVLIQPIGRTWDYYHEVVLHWVGAVIIVGTIAGLAAFYFLLGRLRLSAGRSGRKVLRFTGFERLYTGSPRRLSWCSVLPD
jgi:formate dehydrogenase subunit gamma